MTIQSLAVAFAQAFLKAFAAPRSTPHSSSTSLPAEAAPAGLLTAGGLTAFVNFAGPIVRAVEGRGTLADDADAANVVLDALALFVPASMPIASLIKAAEPAFGAIVDLAQAGVIRGGQPDIMGMETDRNFKNR